MSFFGNNSRPDLLKRNDNEPEPTPRGSEARFTGEAPSQQAPEPVPTFSADARSFANPSTPSSGSNDGALSPDRCTNVVAAGARWKGTLKVEDSARIDGTFSGEVEAKGTVHVSEGADVDAKIHAAYVVISGNFRGEIRADQKAELMPTSTVAGEVITRALSIQEGATLDGSVQMTGDTARNSNASRRNGATPESETASERRNQRSETPTGTNGT